MRKYLAVLAFVLLMVRIGAGVVRAQDYGSNGENNEEDSSYNGGNYNSSNYGTTTTTTTSSGNNNNSGSSPSACVSGCTFSEIADPGAIGGTTGSVDILILSNGTMEF